MKRLALGSYYSRYSVSSRDVPAACIGYGLEEDAVHNFIVHEAAILRIDPQFPHGVLSVELVGPVRLRNRRVSNEPGAWVEGVYEFCLVGEIFIHSGYSDQQALRSEEHTSELQSPCNLV